MTPSAQKTNGTIRRLAVVVAALVVSAQGISAQAKNGSNGNGANGNGQPTTAPDYQRVVNAAYERYKNLREGKNADYIPALAKVDSNLFGIALVTPDGQVYTAGDVSSEVSIQSVSKVFTMAKVIEQSGEKTIADNIGVDATGQVFNSIAAVEQYKGAEMNAMVNPGAITATGMVKGAIVTWDRRAAELARG